MMFTTDHEVSLWTIQCTLPAPWQQNPTPAQGFLRLTHSQMTMRMFLESKVTLHSFCPFHGDSSDSQQTIGMF